MNKVNNKPITLIYIIVVVVAIWAMVKGHQFAAIPLATVDLEKIPELLGSLLAITLFIERSIEVLVNIVRSPGAIDLENQLNDIKNSEASGDHAVGIKKNLREIEKRIVLHKSETQKLSLRVSFSIGILVSAAGIRALGSMVGDIPELPSDQKTFFHFVDILITAGVLAGGSEGIHQLTQVYTDYMKYLVKDIESKKDKLKS